MNIIDDIKSISNCDFVYISNDTISCNTFKFNKDLYNDNYDELVSLVINEFISGNSIGGVAYGIAIKEGIQRNVIEMIDNKRMIIDRELSYEELNNILNKYYEDRFDVVRNGSYDMIELIPGNVYSSKFQLINNKLKMFLSRKINCNEFDESELCFIKLLIDVLFENELIYHKSLMDGSVLSFQLTNEKGDISIKLTDMYNYNSLFIALVNNHNISVKENINRKLKKEGEN